MKVVGTRSIASIVMVVLNISSGIVVLGLVLATMLLAFSQFASDPMEVDVSWMSVGTRMSIPVSFSVDGPSHRIASPSLGIDEATLLDVRGQLRFPARRGAFFFGNTIILLAMLSLALWVLAQLRAVFRTVRDGRPFVPGNATRIRRIGFGVIAGEIARAALVFFENYYAKTHFTADGLRFDARADLNLYAVVCGLIILVIAEVFRTGTRLDEEQSLTV